MTFKSFKVIKTLFTSNNIYLKAYLSKLGVPTNEDIEIVRVISPTRSYIKVNNVLITLNDLKVIAHYLADIHLQFDMTKLLNRENYLDIVDGFKADVIEEYKSKYEESLSLLKEKYNAYQELLNRINEIKKNREFYEFDYQELKALNLQVGEEEEIKEQIAYLKNYDQIYSLLGEIKELIEIAKEAIKNNEGYNLYD